MRQYAAHGRTIAAHVVRGQKPMAIAVMLSSIWRFYDHVPKVCIRPDEWAIGRYELGFLRGLHAIAMPGDECTDGQLAELVIEIMRSGPSLLWVIDVEGKVIYDGEDPHELALWVRGLVAQAGGQRKLSLASIQVAESVMALAQTRAAQLWQREYERVQQRGDLEASTRYALRDYEIRDRVRELFRTPFRDGDARAA